VRLGQVADAIDGTQEQRSLALYNGNEAVGINIVKAKGYSTTDVSSKIRAKVAEIQKTLPPGV
jgi:HAE1 family hydrophobic/amphiphilic exporter-1